MKNAFGRLSSKFDTVEAKKSMNLKIQQQKSNKLKLREQTEWIKQSKTSKGMGPTVYAWFDSQKEKGEQHINNNQNFSKISDRHQTTDPISSRDAKQN